ncbi:MAG: dipeptidase, partial [Acidobacteriota bacterium]|nr:dipeptidase [Acidobacteriota bacterium]
VAPGALLLAELACGPRPAAEPPAAAASEESAAARAAALAHETLIVDTHVDVPYRLREEMEDISERTAKGDFDYPRAVAGGLDAAFLSIYVPSALEDDGAFELAEELIDMVEGFASRWPDKFAVARSVADVRGNFERGVISLPMGMENGAPIEGDLEKLRHFAARGIRYVTLTHAENNHISDSSYAREKTWSGLSPFGREVVAEMNRLGVMIDVSHVSDDAFFQILELTRAPVIASHSSCRHFTPGWERNLSDEMIVALAGNGGVVQVNFGSAFLTREANEQSLAYYAAVGAYADEHGLSWEDPAVKQFGEAWWEANPLEYADLADVVAHVDHVVGLAGVDHVGFGSDFDGVGDSLPAGLKDVSQYPNLLAALLAAGYSEEDVAKIAGGNVLRVWAAVERVAGADV